MTYIYESPDSGKTIYRRKISGTPGEREVLSVSKELEKKQADQDRWIMWCDILTAAESNTALQEALDCARVIYELGRRDNS